ncbi:39S ribosomal protein L47, mitochondrial [Desmophyllum pertusum]|uniref:Large ribosomal subunit protein uL29m n=1 Tax=Desmophyllum pertusum TaxID=174260 RepID=A0A9X0A5F1_9CNID|nr:39S ribosomal protein L47, mitochondrial [Desmophyllum pertusum]
MAAALHRFRCYVFRPFISAESQTRSCVRCLRTSQLTCGLEEFFPPGVLENGELSPESVQTGRKWRAGELRGKSNEDLHKLWYVLLKERNMLNTLRHESKRQGVPMPSPQRCYKVQKSMASIKQVLSEREKVLQTLENEIWPFDEVPEEKPPTAIEEAKEEFANKKNEFGDLVAILSQRNEPAQ